MGACDAKNLLISAGKKKREGENKDLRGSFKKKRTRKENGP